MPHGVLSKNHTELVVFTKQRHLLVRDVLAVEVCEPTCPAAAENHLNFEEPAVKEEKNKCLKLLRLNRAETHTKHDREFGQICL